MSYVAGTHDYKGWREEELGGADPNVALDPNGDPPHPASERLFDPNGAGAVAGIEYVCVVTGATRTFVPVGGPGYVAAQDVFLAAAMTSNNAVGAGDLAAQFQIDARFAAAGLSVKLRAVLSIPGGATATLTLRNLTTAADVTTVARTNVAPGVEDSVELVGLAGFVPGDLYRLTLLTSNVADQALLGSAYLAVRRP